jgi:Fur family zinc uptake transcriptional regulator
MVRLQTLSKNQQAVFDIIIKAKEPLKAYSILYNVQKLGIKAAPQVYRALDKLVEIGKIHKIARIRTVKFLMQLHFQYVKNVKKL